MILLLLYILFYFYLLFKAQLYFICNTTSWSKDLAILLSWTTVKCYLCIFINVIWSGAIACKMACVHMKVIYTYLPFLPMWRCRWSLVYDWSVILLDFVVFCIFFFTVDGGHYSCRWCFPFVTLEFFWLIDWLVIRLMDHVQTIEHF